MKSENKISKFSLYSLFANISYYWGLISTVSVGLAIIVDPKGIFDNNFVVGFGLGCVAPLATGYLMRKKAKRLKDENSSAINEKIALRAMSQNNGQITAAQLSLQTDISLEQASSVLQELAGRGVFYPDVSENGTVIYICDELKKL